MEKRSPALLLVGVIALSLSVTAVASQKRKTSKGATTSRAKESSGPRLETVVTKRPPAKSGSFAEQNTALYLKLSQYRGLSVRPHINASGETLKLHQEICDSMSLLDFVPQARIDHFKWIIIDKNMPINGWTGSIEETAPAPTGVRVELKISPTSGPTQFSDHVYEYYLYSSSNLRYLDSQDRNYIDRYGMTIQ
jgi:hypothetical protein